MKFGKNLGHIFVITLLLSFIQSIVIAQAVYTYSEKTIELKDGIVGIVSLPAVNGKLPVVLLLHGFASQKDEVGDMYKRLAAKLATEKGIASLRIDFRGWGDSAGDMSDSTIQGQVADTQSAYEYLISQDKFDASRIAVVGFSLGGGIAIISAAENPSWYKSMVVWSSVGDFYADFLSSLGQDSFDKAATEGIVTIDLGWRSISLKDGFFKSLKSYNLEAEIGNYSGAFLIISGDQDFSASYADILLAKVASGRKDKLIIAGADHIYGVLSDDQTFANAVIDQTAEWFAKTLY